MNEKTKQILRYVACGLGGLALGIGLLGGLAMCASSGNRSTAESVNTILTKRNALSTTEQGGYDSYTFSVDVPWGTDGYIGSAVYSFDYSTATLTLDETASQEMSSVGWSHVVSYIGDFYDSVTVDADSLKFFILAGRSQVRYSGTYRSWVYYSFKQGSVAYTGYEMSYLSYLCTSYSFNYGYSINFPDNEITATLWTYTGGEKPYLEIITYAQNTVLNFRGDDLATPNTLSFQDTISYYKEQGYQNGYEDGYTEGNSAGYSSGYAEGYETGESVGYSSGYAEGFRTGYMNTYYAFTSLTANLNKVWNMAEIPWHRNTDILVTQDNFNDFPFFDIAHLQVGIYINWAYLALFRDTVTLTPYYVYAQRYTTSQNDGYNVCINIAPASQDTIQEDGNIGGTTGPYLLQEDSLFQLSHTTVWTAPNRCRLIGFMDDTEDIYTDWFDDGYLIPQGIEVNGNAYEEGYRQGQHDATNDTDIQNVFSLLTPAFTAVGGFFNLKVFGFLPLYWFFLAPLFVALITLILRMVKH